MRHSYDLVRQHLGEGAQRMKGYYDMKVKPVIFKPNVWVYYYSPRRYVGRSPKWQKMYTGPFLITRMYGPVNAVLQKSRRSQPFVVHIDKLKLCWGPTPVSWLTETDQEFVEVPESEDTESFPPDLGFMNQSLEVIPEADEESEDPVPDTSNVSLEPEDHIESPTTASDSSTTNTANRPRRQAQRPRRYDDFYC